MGVGASLSSSPLHLRSRLPPARCLLLARPPLAEPCIGPCSPCNVVRISRSTEMLALPLACSLLALQSSFVPSDLPNSPFPFPFLSTSMPFPSTTRARASTSISASKQGFCCWYALQYALREGSPGGRVWEKLVCGRVDWDYIMVSTRTFFRMTSYQL